MSIDFTCNRYKSVFVIERADVSRSSEHKVGPVKFRLNDDVVLDLEAYCACIYKER